jgi:hypothetical protein
MALIMQFSLGMEVVVGGVVEGEELELQKAIRKMNNKSSLLILPSGGM